MEPSVELGRYRILGEIGRGASGTVYRALDTLIGREVAIKSFHSPAGDRSREGLRDELLREARSAGMLSHPNVVTVYDVLEGSDGSWFMAMEYVEGRSLAEVLADGAPLDFERAVDWISQIAAALDYLHAMGLVHRDVKPANVLVTGAGRLKLTDFGIASPAWSPTRGEAPGEGEDEEILGTPGYMAPEQILGREITSRTDLWSLGVVLYEMLTGRRPFAGRSVAQVVHRVVHSPVPPPEEGPELPAGVRELLERALAKDPSGRFASAGELARKLRRVLYRAAGEAGEEDLSDAAMLDRTLVAAPAGSPRPAPGGRVAAWQAGWRRLHSPTRVLVAGLLAALLVALLAWGAVLASRDPAPAPEPAEGGGTAVAGRSVEAPLPREGRDGVPGGAGARVPATTVRIELSSEVPEGVLTVYGAGEELLHRGFSYYRPGSLFGPTPSSGGFEVTIAVPAGVEALQIYVARLERPARRLEVPVRPETGSGPVLRIHLPAEGEATAVWGDG